MSQPLLTREVLQSLPHLHSPLLDSLVVCSPELDTAPSVATPVLRTLLSIENAQHLPIKVQIQF